MAAIDFDAAAVGGYWIEDEQDEQAEVAADDLTACHSDVQSSKLTMSKPRRKTTALSGEELIPKTSRATTRKDSSGVQHKPWEIPNSGKQRTPRWRP